MVRLMLLFVAVYHAFTLQTMSQDVITLDPLVSGFSQPVDIVSSGDQYLYVVEKRGRVRVTDTLGNFFDTPLLDIRQSVNSNGFELGLLGMTFHPAYPDSPYYYVNYTREDESTVVERFAMIDPFNTETASREVILVQSQPFSNHNAGDLEFGPDGYLYIGFGDGGAGDDPQMFSQNRQSFLGKMLRIDVDNGSPYTIPDDNPFAEDDETLDEIWALGLRNPWRYSFDRLTGDLYIADVGQGQREEVNRQASTSVGGENYGWRCFEGTLPYLQQDCPSSDELTLPVYEYAHQGSNCGGSITGGYVYRGSSYPDLYGKYIMVDYCTGVFRSWNTVDSTSEIIYQGDQAAYSTFGEDANGELYVASIGGTIYRVKSTATSILSPVAKVPLSIYPNPARSRVFIDAPSSMQLKDEVKIYNSLGMCVISRNYSSSLGLDISQLGAGVYYALVTLANDEQGLGTFVVTGSD